MNSRTSGERAGEFLFALGLAGVFAWAIFKAWSWSLGAALFPLLIAAPGLLLAVVVSVRILLRTPADPGAASSGRPSQGDLSLDEELMTAEALVRTGAIFGWILGLLLLVWLLGQKIALPLFVFLYLRASREGWIPTLLLTLGTLGFLLAVFDQMIHVTWHEGVVFQWLGWEPF